MRFNNWFCTHLTQPRTRQVFRPRPPRRKRVHLRLEVLEDRILLSHYTAATVSDLIADINAANAAGGSNTITLIAPSIAPYVLTAVNNSTDGPTGLPVIAAGDSLTITGHGDTIERSRASGTPAFRLLDVASGATLTLHDLTLSGGLEIGAAAQGGAIFSQGDLTLKDTVVQGNMAQGNTGATGQAAAVGQAGGSAQGGGIYEAGGSLTLTDGTILSNNQALGGKGGEGGTYGTNTTKFHLIHPGSGGVGGNGSGGGIYQAGGSLSLTGGALLSSNQALGGAGGNAGGSYHLTGLRFFPHPAQGGNGGSGSGGGLYLSAGILNLSATLTNNQAIGGSGGSGFAYAFPSTRGGIGGSGGSGEGGGLYASNSTLTISAALVVNNQTQGGLGGQGGSAVFHSNGVREEFGNGSSGGNGGSAVGGGLDITSSDGQVANLAVLSDTAAGGGGGASGLSYEIKPNGAGGSAAGGGLNLDDSTVSLNNLVIAGNVAQGGRGRSERRR